MPLIASSAERFTKGRIWRLPVVLMATGVMRRMKYDPPETEGLKLRQRSHLLTVRYYDGADFAGFDGTSITEGFEEKDLYVVKSRPERTVGVGIRASPTGFQLRERVHGERPPIRSVPIRVCAADSWLTTCEQSLDSDAV